MTMRVKIGDVWHDSEKEPICVEFIGNDRQNILDMVEGCTKYSSGPDDYFINSKALKAWMGDVPSSEPKPVDMSDTVMTDGSPVTNDHWDLKKGGQQKGYMVLSEAERVKGYVRPVRVSYIHVGLPWPRYPLRDLTENEKDDYAEYGYIKFEVYPDSEAPKTGEYWTQARIDAVGKGCKKLTIMHRSIAETYARSPGFYGETFCSTCKEHLPVAEFTWAPPPGVTGHQPDCAVPNELCDCGFAQVVGS